MNGRTIATIRGKGKREEFIREIGTDRFPILTPMTERAYRIDARELTEQQVSWLLARYGLALPADECTISMEE